MKRETLAFVGCMLLAVAFSMLSVHGCESERAATVPDAPGTAMELTADDLVTTDFYEYLPTAGALPDTPGDKTVDVMSCDTFGNLTVEVWEEAGGHMCIKFYTKNTGNFWAEDTLTVRYTFTGQFYEAWDDTYWRKNLYPGRQDMRCPYPCQGPYCGNSLTICFTNWPGGSYEIRPGRYAIMIHTDSGNAIDEFTNLGPDPADNNVLFYEFDWPLVQ